MKISVNHINEFQKRVRGVQTSSIMPILKYISLSVKNGVCTLYKTNLGSFCKYSFPFEHEDIELLLEEKIFFDFASNAKSEAIEVSIDDNLLVTLKELNRKLSFKVEPSVLYPAFPENATIKDPISITSEHIKSISIASKYVDTSNPNAPYASYIYVTDNSIWASNGFVIYNKEFEGLSKIILTKEAAGIISQFLEFTYYSIGNHDFFDNGSTCYGFVKPDIGAPDISPIIKHKREKIGMVVDKEQLEIFCNTSISLSNMFSYCFMESDGADVLFTMDDNDSSKSNRMSIQVENKIEFDKFKFDAKKMLQCLSALPYDYVSFHLVDNKIILQHDEDKKYFGVIMGLNHIN